MIKNKENTRRKKEKQIVKVHNKGITLIALVITIIVLLILAAVSIATLTGQNGILSRANDAKEDTERETAKEKVAVEVLGSYGDDGKLDYGLLEKNLNNIKGIQGVPRPITDASFPIKVTVDGYEVTIEKNGNVTVGDKNNNPPQTGTILNEAKDDSMLTKDTDTDVTVTDGTVKVPAGFKVADDSGATIDDGIVITDAPDGEEGNEFVWVPVSEENFDTEFVRRAGYSSGSPQSMTNYGEVNADGINVKIDATETGVTESSATVQEAKLMYASVKRNGGFYIGRYEAGKEGDSVVVKKGADVYNYVAWSKNGTMNEETSTENTKDGAIELARNFAKNKYPTVTSTLCYGVQWDAALKWIDPNYTGFAKYSSGMGWYSGVSGNADHKTGIDLKEGDSVKNMTKKIYDLAGNVIEWTMESYYTIYRVDRGGDFDNSGSGSPASRRSSSVPSNDNFDNRGFRVTLYLNS